MSWKCCVGCEKINSYWSREGQSCPAHRYRIGTPAPQGVGAVAAIERDDRSAISVHVPRCRPGKRSNKVRHTVRVPVFKAMALLRSPVTANVGTRNRRRRDGKVLQQPVLLDAQRSEGTITARVGKPGR